MDGVIDSGSPSLIQRDYWWYRAREGLLEAALDGFVPSGCAILDIGSADAPSAGWLARRGRVVAVDIDVRGLSAGGVAGSAEALPFRDGTFDVVSAFDVVEHCSDEARALSEAHRVLRPGGVFLMSVPAYEWAWTDHDVHNEHLRRYTRGRATAALESQGLEVVRATYVFAGSFPFFAADRLRARWKESRRTTPERQHGDVLTLPAVGPRVERLLMAVSQLDRRLLGRFDLPFGSSVVCAARKRFD